MANISIPTSVAGISLPGNLGQGAKGPLSVLFGGKGADTYNYPSDLATDPSKNHYVQFLVKEIVPAGYSSSAATSKGSQLNLSGAGQALSSVGGSISGGTGLFSGVTDSIGKSISEVGGFFQNNSLSISPQTTQAKAYISLYMPDTLNATYSATYDTLSLTNDLGSTAQTARMISSAAPGAVDAIKSGDSGSMMNFAGQSPEAIALAASLGGGAASALGIEAGALRDVLLKGKGYAINPQLQMLYRGTDFRSFQLSFTFTPKSQAESDTVKRIVDTFKYHHAPSLQAGKSDSNDSMFLIPPSIFNVQFKIGQEENQYLPKYGDLVLRNITVDYAPNGFAAYETGAPVQSTLTLDFQETVVLDRDKIAKGTLR